MFQEIIELSVRLEKEGIIVSTRDPWKDLVGGMGRKQEWVERRVKIDSNLSKY